MDSHFESNLIPKRISKDNNETTSVSDGPKSDPELAESDHHNGKEEEEDIEEDDVSNYSDDMSQDELDETEEEEERDDDHKLQRNTGIHHANSIRNHHEKSTVNSSRNQAINRTPGRPRIQRRKPGSHRRTDGADRSSRPKRPRRKIRIRPQKTI